MLSVEKCKTLISNKSLSDKEVETVRDELYQLADMLIEKYMEARRLDKHEPGKESQN
jgi:hypothetical protein